MQPVVTTGQRHSLRVRACQFLRPLDLATARSWPSSSSARVWPPVCADARRPSANALAILSSRHCSLLANQKGRRGWMGLVRLWICARSSTGAWEFGSVEEGSISGVWLRRRGLAVGRGVKGICIVTAVVLVYKRFWKSSTNSIPFKPERLRSLRDDFDD